MNRLPSSRRDATMSTRNVLLAQHAHGGVSRSRRPGARCSFRAMYRLGLLGVVVVTACGSDPKVIPCDADVDCNLRADGQCVASPAGEDHCAYPLASCSSGYAFGELSGDIAGECVAPVFDVAYAREWRFSISAPAVGGFALIVNTGSTAFELDDLRVVSVTDDHADAVVQVAPDDLVARLEPGNAAYASAEVVSNLVPETRRSGDESIWLSIENLPGGPLQSTFDINASVTMALGDAHVVLPVTFLMVSGLDPVVVADAESGARKSAFR